MTGIPLDRQSCGATAWAGRDAPARSSLAGEGFAAMIESLSQARLGAHENGDDPAIPNEVVRAPAPGSVRNRARAESLGIAFIFNEFGMFGWASAEAVPSVAGGGADRMTTAAAPGALSALPDVGGAGGFPPPPAASPMARTGSTVRADPLARSANLIRPMSRAEGPLAARNRENTTILQFAAGPGSAAASASSVPAHQPVAVRLLPDRGLPALPESETGGSAAPGLPRRPQLLACGTGAVDLVPIVRLSVAENGASLFARLQRLSREERVRLQHEAARLLARCGFGLTDIRINGAVCGRGA